MFIVKYFPSEKGSPLEPGDKVRHKVTGEIGTIIKRHDGGLYNDTDVDFVLPHLCEENGDSVGKISYGSRWVEEDDMFDFTQVKFVEYVPMMGMVEMTYHQFTTCREKNDKDLYIEIKCTKCQHFH